MWSHVFAFYNVITIMSYCSQLGEGDTTYPPFKAAVLSGLQSTGNVAFALDHDLSATAAALGQVSEMMLVRSTVSPHIHAKRALNNKNQSDRHTC